MGINLGATAISDIKLGSNSVSKVYLGTTEVWSGGTPPTPTIRALKFSTTGTQILSINTDVLGSISPNFEYSTDEGTTWTTWDFSQLEFGVIGQTNKDLYLRGTNTKLADSSGYVNLIFMTTSPVTCTGNIMHLFDHTQDLTAFPSSSDSQGIKKMFYGADVLVSAPDLPATTLTDFCYYQLFANCSSLASAPDLPATTSTYNCYYAMFESCSSMTSAPSLPATVLNDSCYEYMFYMCSSMTSIPELPATTLVHKCYAQMFRGCSSIKMSATQTGEYQNVYTFGANPSDYSYNMFRGTGGTFTGTPTAQTYYTSNTIVSAS